MRDYKQPEVFITGLGITASIGQGKENFFSALLQGLHAFSFMQRLGRQREVQFIGAEIPTLSYPKDLSKRLLRNASFSAHVAMVTLSEAWTEAKLDTVDPDRIGLVIGGSNFQQREILQTYETYRERAQFISPTYGISFMDSDLCGICTEQFGIQGLAYTVGGASASGQLAVMQAVQAVLSGQVDICIALGALMDISYLECQAWRALGAMGTDLYMDEPAKACRPFDKKRDGFIYGESCGAVVIERTETALSRQVNPYAAIVGGAIKMDGNRHPNPSLNGEVQVIQKVLMPRWTVALGYRLYQSPWYRFHNWRRDRACRNTQLSALSCLHKCNEIYYRARTKCCRHSGNYCHCVADERKSLASN